MAAPVYIHSNNSNPQAQLPKMIASPILCTIRRALHHPLLQARSLSLSLCLGGAMAMAKVSPSPSPPCPSLSSPIMVSRFFTSSLCVPIRPAPHVLFTPRPSLSLRPRLTPRASATGSANGNGNGNGNVVPGVGFNVGFDRRSATGAELGVACAPSAGLGFGGSSRWVSSRMIRGVLVAAPLIFGALFGNAIASAAAEHSIGSSSLGLKVAAFLRGSGLSDEAIVAAVASLPALELRGAIPVGYWMKLPPQKTYALAVIGNMLPVPFIALYLEKFFNYVASSSEGGRKLVDKIITNTRRKAEPIEEFKWIGLMLFVAVPFPGTGAWTGAFAASILGMSFWESMSANFVGVLLAGILVNLVVSVGIREAIFVGIALFLLSLFMWRILRFFNQKKASDA
ncbi:hypothetical protein KC19_5G117000 [Ceratodon purpureus]|uniref:Uncharacterized protein n=1 Tax=Ceratodon purpureus TaxID=3225 RepID=A0A8T0I2X4_CERPU|nr:hypothetical protein KC19_5G117000 [Ceratodon purpureus]